MHILFTNVEHPDPLYIISVIVYHWPRFYSAWFNPGMYLAVLFYYLGSKNCAFFCARLNWLDKFLPR